MNNYCDICPTTFFKCDRGQADSCTQIWKYNQHDQSKLFPHHLSYLPEQTSHTGYPPPSENIPVDLHCLC